MDFRLNLLPETLKKQTKRTLLLLATKDAVLSLVAAISFVAIMLLGSRTILENTITRVGRNITVVEKQNTGINQAIATINQRTAAFAAIKREWQSSSVPLAVIAELVPTGVTLHTLEVNLSSRTVRMQGYAPTRDLFLAFKNGMERSPQFVAVESPLTNILVPRQITFTLSASLKP